MSNDTAAPATLDDYRWLVGPEVAEWFGIANSLAAEANSTLVRLVQRLRAELSPARAHLILEQRELRSKAREKFPHAEKMFFTRRGLEQATDAAVAAYKASRFPREGRIVDLCCGMGGDSLALARRGWLMAVDRDPAAVILAQANLEAVSGGGSVQHTWEIASAEEYLDRAPILDAWHIDPDRRASGARSTKVQFHDPGPEVLARLLKHCPHGAIKLAPAADLAETWWSDAELEWISRRRQCRQLTAWFGGLAENPGRRRATVIRNSADFSPAVAATFVGEPNVEIAIANKIDRYFFEPDAAVLAAKLEGALAEQHGLTAIASGIAYFTGDHAIDDALLDSFEVLEILPYDVRRVRQWLIARNLGRLEIKKRGVPLEPKSILRELANDGSDAATVLLAKFKGQVHAIIARRIEK